MKVELSDLIYEFEFHHCQIEITGKCNMHCEHCRAIDEERSHITMDFFRKCLEFAQPKDDFELILSGGEPFLHPQLTEMVKMANDFGIEKTVITTNASICGTETIKSLKSICNQLALQISIDSPDEQEHDIFRNFNGAFQKALATVRMCKELGVFASVRTTVSPKTIDKMEQMLLLAAHHGAGRIGFGSVVPTGKGKINKDLLMTRKDKKLFMENIFHLKEKHPEIIVVTGDPLKFCAPQSPWSHPEEDMKCEGFFAGCEGGISGFNVDVRGNLTPCALLLEKIINLKALDLETARTEYVNSPIIKNLFLRPLKGRCGTCAMKKACGGCRAAAYGMTGDYLEEDPTCFWGPITEPIPR